MVSSSSPSPSDLLAGLNSAQVQAVTAPVGTVVVLAGAGSGKTRVLSRRIAWRILNGDVDPERVLALTFTRKAAAELRERQRKLGLRDRVPAGTFHSVALAQLRQRWGERGVTPPALINNRVGFVTRVLPGGLKANVSEITAEIDWARARLIEPDEYRDEAERFARRPPIDADRLAEIMTAYEQEKRRRRVVDFDDLLWLAVRDIESDPNYAAAIRWRHRHFFVDEFQDVNPRQYRLLKAWLGPGRDLFLVGDPNQAIYAWNGADPNLLARFSASPEATVIKLNDNYRSTPEILRISGAVLNLDPRLQAHRANGPRPTVTAAPTDSAEAEMIAERLRRCHSANSRWSDQAVLVRTNAQLTLIEDALKRWRIPYQLRVGPGPLASVPVRQALDRLGRGDADLVAGLEHLDETLAVDTSTLSTVDAERHRQLLALSRAIHDYLVVDPRPTGPGLVAWIKTLNGFDMVGDDDAVALATFHSAKGLEWPIVHLAGLEDGFSPIAYARTDEQLAEEQRLLYVALTRAERELHLTWAQRRTFAQSPTVRDASPFLAAVSARIAQLEGREETAGNWRGHIANTRNRLSPSAPAEPDTVLAELRAWRDRKARAAGVPGHVILGDRALQAIAERRPTTVAALGAAGGIGPAKLARLGQELLDLIAASRSEAQTG